MAWYGMAVGRRACRLAYIYQAAAAAGLLSEALLGLLRAGVVNDPALVQRAAAIEQSLSWFVQPSGRMVNFGDTDSTDISRSPAQALQTWSTGAMRAVTTGGLVGGAVPAGLKIFPDTGYAIIRQPDRQTPRHAARALYLAQTAAFHSRTRKHADDLSFVWSDKGQPILTDAGRYGYIGRTEVGSDLFEDGHWYADPMRIFIESTRAHNTLEFDRRNMPRKGVAPYGSALRGALETDGVFAIETGCTHFRSIRHDRVLLFSPGRWLLAYDVFADRRKEPHDVRQWFHLPQGAQVLSGPDGYDAVLPQGGQKLTVRSLFAEGHATEVIEGQSGCQYQGWWSGDEGQADPAPALAFLMQGRASGAFATLFSPSDSVTPDKLWSKANASGRQA